VQGGTWKALRTVSTPRFLAILAVGLALAAAFLVLASVLDAPALRFVAVACILGVFVGRELWIWRDWRWALAIPVALLVVVVLAFLAQRLG
jgi:hypothetical protein